MTPSTGQFASAALLIVEVSGCSDEFKFKLALESAFEFLLFGAVGALPFCSTGSPVAPEAHASLVAAPELVPLVFVSFNSEPAMSPTGVVTSAPVPDPEFCS